MGKVFINTLLKIDFALWFPEMPSCKKGTRAMNIRSMSKLSVCEAHTGILDSYYAVLVFQGTESHAQ